MVNLTDNSGNPIWSGPDNWYKIALADGTELGLDHDDSNWGYLKIVPACQGMVVRYQRQEDNNRPVYGWPIGDKGYFICMQRDIRNKP
ncbi:hypothetical protein FNYG_11495 [Fusarium nygamai]|uniref:Uncharacterized protein n=1 Tax=Gibberella nygamai TaxID=42673 RepID=A0A2K0VYR8_GIBNY|nr:hypothetical protein FNYG_11495 [Fusarium nygamai]